jgi:hypothetical protein
VTADMPRGRGLDGVSDALPDHASRNTPQSARPTPPAEFLDRREYYEALRAAPDGSVDRTGWDTADEVSRPPLDALRISPERATHILGGDATGGRHRHGTGSPGKTEFPANWSDGRILETVLAVSRRPETVHRQWNDRWKVRGERDQVWVTAIVNPDGAVWTAWPEEGSPGVVRNPERGSG